MGIQLCRSQTVLVMDADLSHRPESIPAMLAALDGVDMVVGSRYTEGGQIDVDWGWHRRLISRLGTVLARPLVACADPLSGFFALDRRAVPDTSRLKPIGYKIGLELMVRGRMSIAEIPITFHDRNRGKSKFKLMEQYNFIRHLIRLYRDAFTRRFRCINIFQTRVRRRSGSGSGTS